MKNPFEILDQRLTKIESLLLDIKHQSKETKEEQKWFNLEELCEYLPDKPSKATIYAKVSKREIPFHKTGKKLRFFKRQIDNWLLEGKTKTINELESEVDDFIIERRLG